MVEHLDYNGPALKDEKEMHDIDFVSIGDSSNPKQMYRALILNLQIKNLGGIRCLNVPFVLYQYIQIKIYCKLEI